MVATFQAILCVMMIETVISLNHLPFAKKESQSGSGGPTNEQKSLRRVLASLANAKLYITSGDRKSIDPLELTKTKSLLEVLAKRRYAAKGVNYLREEQKEDQEAEDQRNSQVPVRSSELARNNIDVHEKLVENELQNTMSKHSSALLSNAWVEKKGRNDFLVLEDEAKDPFVTIIPNNIYYNIEKKCVNWLDDCSLQGIRAKLLQRVQSPYKNNMLFFLILVALIETSRTKDDYQLVATALYYSDAKGRVLLVTNESLPKEITQVIEDDVRTRMKMDLPIRVVPAYNSVDDVPYRRHVIKHLKKKFPAMYNANISREKSVNMFSNMRKYMLSPLQKYWMQKKGGRRPRPEWDDTPTSNDEEDVPSVRPPKPKSGEAKDMHSYTSYSSGLPTPGGGDNGGLPTLGGGDNGGQDNKDPNGEHGNLKPYTTNFSYLDPGNHGWPYNKDKDPNGEHGNLKPYTTNFSYLDPGNHGWPYNKDKDPNGEHSTLKPYTTNFSYLDPGNHGWPYNKDKDPNGEHGNLKPYTTNFSYLDPGNHGWPYNKDKDPNGEHSTLKPYTTNFSYLDPGNHGWPYNKDKDPNGEDGNLKPYTTNFSYLDPGNHGWPYNKDKDPNSEHGNLKPYTTNFSYLDHKDKDPNGEYGNLKPYTTNFTYLDPDNHGKPYDKDNDSKGNRDHLRPYTTNFSYIDKLKSTNSYDPLKPYTTNFSYIDSSTKGYCAPQDEFIPNDIYYGIEKTCVNWNSLCDLRSPGLDSIPASYIKFPNLVNPPILHWVP